MDNDEAITAITPEKPKADPGLWKQLKQQRWLNEKVGANFQQRLQTGNVAALTHLTGQFKKNPDGPFVVHRYKSKPEKFETIEEATTALHKDWGTELIDNICRLTMLESLAPSAVL